MFSHCEWFLVTIFVLFFETIYGKEHSNKVQFILDFAGNEKVPTTTVNWSDCFSENDKLVMMKKSLDAIVFVKETSLQQTDYTINPQNFLFVIDFTCTTTMEQPLEMLKKVNFLFIFTFF